jgi:hypothetical protein
MLVLVAATALLSLPSVLDRLLYAGGESRQPWFRSVYAKTAWYTVLAVITLSVTAVLNAPAPQIVYRAF